MIADIAAVLNALVWVWIVSVCILVSAAGLIAFHAGRITCEHIGRRHHTRHGIRRLESFANHPANRIRKEDRP